MPVADHIDNATRSVTFNPVASAGPFALPFPIYEADSAAELKSDFLVALAGVVQTAYSVSGTFTDGVAIDGAITMDAPVTGALVVYSRRRPRSSVDLSDGQAVTALELQGMVNGLLASVRDIYDWMASLEAANVLPAGTFVPTAGGVMSGFLTLNANPVNVLHAAPKQYVDSKLPLTTKGDISTFAAAPARLAVGADGKKLVADSSAATGLAWKRNGGSIQTLVDAANIAWDMDLGDDAKVTLGGNRTLSAPANEVIGQFGYLDVIQDGTGSRTLAWNAAYKTIEGNIPPQPDPTIGITTRYYYRVRGADDVVVSMDAPSAIDILLANVTMGAGTTFTISSATIRRPYKRLELIINGVSHNDATNRSLRLELSGDNGGGWTAPTDISQVVNAATVNDGKITIDNAAALNDTRIINALTNASASGFGGAPFWDVYTQALATGFINALRLSWNGTGSFDATGANTLTLIGYR